MVEAWKDVTSRGRCTEGEMIGVAGSSKCFFSMELGVMGEMSIGDVGEIGSTGDIVCLMTSLLFKGSVHSRRSGNSVWKVNERQ